MRVSPCFCYVLVVCRYTLQKKLTGQREAIYECNVFCACHAHGCANRVIGKGLGQRLQVGMHRHSHLMDCENEKASLDTL